MYHIVIVEDDLNFALQLKNSLLRFNYEVSIIEDFKKVSDDVLNNEYDLVVMDVNLTYQDGFYWTQQIRQHSNIPIIFLSSRDEQLEQVMAMSYGADDYLTKPVDLDLFLVKIQAILRRAYDYDITNKTNVIICDDFKLDITKLEISYFENKIELTKNEFKILKKLMSNAKEYVSREELMNYLWDNDSFIDDNAFNVNMSRLKKKLFELSSIETIHTKRQVGYCFGKK